MASTINTYSRLLADPEALRWDTLLQGSKNPNSNNNLYLLLFTHSEALRFRPREDASPLEKKSPDSLLPWLDSFLWARHNSSCIWLLYCLILFLNLIKMKTTLKLLQLGSSRDYHNIQNVWEGFSFDFLLSSRRGLQNLHLKAAFCLWNCIKPCGTLSTSQQTKDWWPQMLVFVVALSAGCVSLWAEFQRLASWQKPAVLYKLAGLQRETQSYSHYWPMPTGHCHILNHSGWQNPAWVHFLVSRGKVCVNVSTLVLTSLVGARAVQLRRPLHGFASWQPTWESVNTHLTSAQTVPTNIYVTRVPA